MKTTEMCEYCGCEQEHEVMSLDDTIAHLRTLTLRIDAQGNSVLAPEFEAPDNALRMEMSWLAQFAGQSMSDIHALAWRHAASELKSQRGYEGAFDLYAMPVIDATFRYVAVPVDGEA